SPSRRATCSAAVPAAASVRVPTRFWLPAISWRPRSKPWVRCATVSSTKPRKKQVPATGMATEAARRVPNGTNEGGCNVDLVLACDAVGRHGDRDCHSDLVECVGAERPADQDWAQPCTDRRRCGAKQSDQHRAGDVAR